MNTNNVISAVCVVIKIVLVFQENIERYCNVKVFKTCICKFDNQVPTHNVSEIIVLEMHLEDDKTAFKYCFKRTFPQT